MGISSRIGTFAIAYQTSGKGTPATAPTHKFFYAGSPSLAPTKNTARFAMTDSGRDQGDSYVTSLGVGGDVPLYAHPQGMGILMAGVLGATADGGTTPNYTHTITPANGLFYFTCWRMVGGVLVEKFQDCVISSLSLTGSAGSPLTTTISLLGTQSTFLTSDTADTMLVEDTPYLYMDAGGAIEFNSVAQTVHSITYTINNNASAYFADQYFASDVDPGNRDIAFSFATRFSGPTAFPDYRSFFYGSDTGTTLSAAIGTTPVSLTWTKDANTSMKIDMPNVAFNAIPIAPDPGGAPIETTVACSVEKDPGGDPITTVTIADAKATAFS